ncbi:MAG: alkaline phosphatase family protein [Myxococcales bacterium]|nr:alkaline phosphatase family protein [Myxococcales bacterium]MCB9709521.1 alkaline phosphatase family protein [Myxococcales bacterium]
MPGRRVLIIGLDCADPGLVFDRFAARMPNVHQLMQRGLWGKVRSSIPPITVPAWMCMVSGRDPGELGLYGFRARVSKSYDLGLVDAEDMKEPCLWDYISHAEKRVAVVGVPMTYPPRAVNGVMISGCLTPSDASPYVWPESRKQEFVRRFGPYLMDVADARTEDPPQLFSALCAMTKQRFSIAKYLWSTDQPDFLMMVDMGPDRLHHAMWACFDPDHPRHIPGHPMASWGSTYYGLLDHLIGEMLELIDDQTVVCIVSDHGARALHGGVCINEWLQDQGLLVLKETPQAVTPLHASLVDWEKTQVWAEGGYYSRIFVNLEGREPSGCVSESRYESLRAEIISQLETLLTPDGHTLHNRILKPEQIYRATRGSPPDLMAFFDDLRYRGIGTVGHGTCFVTSNAEGCDGCNHNWDGILVMAGAGVPARGRQDGLQIFDLTRTVLSVFDIPQPVELLGRDLFAHRHAM